MTARPARSPRPVVCDCKFGHQHGTRRMYTVHKCGCLKCRAAHARSETTWRNGGTTAEDRYTDPTGTRRRIQGLAALGVSHAALAAELGCKKENIVYLRTSKRVHVATAQRVATAFAALLARPLPTGWQADRTRREAATKGWLSPFAWDDLDDPDEAPQLPEDRGWTLAACGTPAAYRRHTRRGEQPCKACCRAEADRARNYRKRVA